MINCLKNVILNLCIVIFFTGFNEKSPNKAKNNFNFEITFSVVLVSLARLRKFYVFTQ